MGARGLEHKNVTNEIESTYGKSENQRVQNPEKIPDLAGKWDSLTDIEKQIIMKLLK